MIDHENVAPILYTSSDQHKSKVSTRPISIVGCGVPGSNTRLTLWLSIFQGLRNSVNATSENQHISGIVRNSPVLHVGKTFGSIV